MQFEGVVSVLIQIRMITYIPHDRQDALVMQNEALNPTDIADGK